MCSPGCNCDLENVVVLVLCGGVFGEEINQLQAQVRGENEVAQLWAAVEVKLPSLGIKQPCSDVYSICGCLPVGIKASTPNE